MLNRTSPSAMLLSWLFLTLAAFAGLAAMGGAALAGSPMATFALKCAGTVVSILEGALRAGATAAPEGLLSAVLAFLSSLGSDAISYGRDAAALAFAYVLTLNLTYSAALALLALPLVVVAALVRAPR